MRSTGAVGPARVRRVRILATLAVAAVVASACSPGAGTAGAAPAHDATDSTTATAGRPAAPAGGTTATTTTSVASVRLLVEPGQIAPIYALLASPGHTLDMAMYELVDTRAEQILGDDAARGVRVRVVLDRNRERYENSAAYSYLNAHRVHAVWAPSSYDATHEKAVVVDAGYGDARALIMTLNLTSRYYSSTRDYAVVDPNRADVAAIESVFAADFAGRSSSPTPRGADLVWSPGSEAALVAMIRSARSSVSVENEEMSNYAIVDALETDARRGVRTRVVMTSDREYDDELSGIAASGGVVHIYPDSSSALYIHGKVIVVDAGTSGARAFVGSENFSTASLEYNRELGLVVTRPVTVTRLATTLSDDFARAPVFRP